MTVSRLLPKLSLLFAIILLAGCAASGVKEEDMSPEQLALRQQEQVFNKTVGQGAMWGAAIGGIAMALLGGDAGDIAKGAAIGAGVGAIGGTYFANKQKQYANEEQRIASITEDVRARNAQTAQWVANGEQVVKRDREKLAALQRERALRVADESTIKREIATIREDSKLLHESIAATDFHIAQFKDARDAQLKQNPYANVAALNQEISELESQKARIENMVAAINSDLESFSSS